MSDDDESAGLQASIRAARDDDRDALMALIEPIFGEYEGVLFVREEMPELEQIASVFARAGGAFWCAERRGAVVGSVGFTPAVSGAGVELKKLYVARSEREHGLGARLLAQVEDAARARGADFVELWSDVRFVAAHRFYERRGYRRDGRTRELGDASDSVEYHFRRELGSGTAERGTGAGRA
jgi:putative acetyltransferase